MAPRFVVVHYLLENPFIAAGTTVLWVSLSSLAVVFLPGWPAKALALGLVFGHTAVAAFWLQVRASPLWVFPLLCLAAALTVACWQRAGAACSGKGDTWLRRVAIMFAAALPLEAAAGLAFHVDGCDRFDRSVAEMEAFLGTKVSFDLARFERPSPAAREARAAVAEFAPSAEERARISAVLSLPVDAWPPAAAARLREIVDRHRRPLDLLEATAGRGRCSYGLRYRDGMSMSAYPYFSLRLSDLLSVASRVALARGDEADGLRAARALARLGDCLDEEPAMIFRLYAAVTRKRLSRIALEAASSPEAWASPSLLAGLAEILPAADGPERWQETILFEALAGSRSFRYGPPQIGWPADPSAVSWFVFGPRAGAKVLTESRQALEVLHRSGWLRRKVEGECPPPSWVRGGYDFYVCSRSYALDFVFRRRVAASQAQLARAALAVRLHALARGGYPRQRPNLPDLLQKEPLAGQLLTYRLLEDGSLRLEAEEAAELQKRSGLFPRRPDVFRVTLPPPPRGS